MGLSDLPLDKGTVHQKVFEAFGWVLRRAGEHIVMTHPSHSGVTLSIPNHREVRRGTLHSLVRSASLTDKQYRAMYDSL